jgi:PKD repeat protein
MKRILLSLVLGCSLIAHAQAQCSAKFSYTANNNIVTFSAADSLAYGSSWDFGDGNVNWGAISLSHNYNNPGTYSVKHWVTDTITKCSDSSVQSISVQFTPSCSASFGYYIDSIHLGHYFFYDASTIIGSNYLGAQWTIDGAVIANNTQTFSSDFTQTGTYHVCEQIKTSSGCASSSCQDILVPTIDSCNLNASFTYTPEQSNPSAIMFSPTMDTGTNVSYSWYFGDGIYDSTKNPVHIFAKGIYYVNLTLQKRFTNTTNCNANFSAPVYINIGPADTCSINFTYTANPGKPNVISFTENSGQPIASQQWAIYKGWESLVVNSAALAYLKGNNPTYTFPDSGYYFITLKITTDAGCASSTAAEIFIDSIARGTVLPNSVTQMPVYPNPATNNVNLLVTLPSNNNIGVNIYSAVGNLIITKQIAGTSGDNRLSIPVQNLKPGVYYIKINYGSEVKRSRFQKL